MGNTKFTSGAWANEGPDASNGMPFITITAGEHGTPSYRFICEVSPEFDEYHGFSITDQTHANARLIAAAPDLYEALLAMATRHKDSPYIGMARAALAKANPPTA